MEFNHHVRTFNLSGKFIYEESFQTAEKAYEEYLHIIKNAQEQLPAGYGVVVVRYWDNNIMAEETIIGNK